MLLEQMKYPQRPSIIEGRMNLTTIVGIQSGPDDEGPFKLFRILATSTTEAGYNTIDLRQGGPR
jgi:hypothetical protein